MPHVYSQTVKLLYFLSCLSSLGKAVPAGTGVMTIDTDATVIVNQIVSTVTASMSTVTVGTCDMNSALVMSSPSPSSQDPLVGVYNTAATLSSPVPSAIGTAIATMPYSAATSTTLLPVAPPGQTSAHPSNVLPSSSMRLYLSQVTASPIAAAAPSATFAVIHAPQLAYPIVNLNQAGLVNNLTCNSDNTATIQFVSTQAYLMAANNWTSANPFVLITYATSCGINYENGAHDFLLVENIISIFPGSNTILVTTQIIDLEQAVGSTNDIIVTIGGGSTPANGTTTTSGNQNGTTTNGTTSDFDQNLDAALGPSINIGTASGQAQILPDTAINTTALSQPDDLPTVARRDVLQRRGLFDSITSAVANAGNTIQKTAETVIQTTDNQITNGVDAVEVAALKAAGVLDRYATIDKTLSRAVSINQYPSNGNSPFGPAYVIYQGSPVQAYCVGCGADGNLQISAQITFSVANGFKTGFVNAKGNLNSLIQLGLVSSGASVTKPLPETTFAQVSLGDLVLPGILKIGPTARVGAGGSVKVDASGNLLAGARLTWPAIQANINIMSASASGITGFVPAIDPRFQASGNVSATAELHLTTAIGFVIGLLDNRFSKSVELVDQPGVTITAGVAGSAAYNNGQLSGSFSSTGGCSGVAVRANIYNKVFADIAGVLSYDLLSYTSPDLTRCIALAKRDFSGAPYPASLYRRQNTTSSSAGSDSATSATAAIVTAATATASGISAVADTASIATASNSSVGFSVIATLDGSLQMHWASNGNIYAIPANDTADSAANSDASDSSIDTSDATGLFASNNAIIAGDSASRIMHGYSDEIAAYNVTRLRLHIPEVMPATSRAIFMQGIADPAGGPNFLVASDSAGNVFFPVICVYSNDYAKLFMALDPIQGAATLGNLTQITGPGVVSCNFVPFEANGNTEGF